MLVAALGPEYWHVHLSNWTTQYWLKTLHWSLNSDPNLSRANGFVCECVECAYRGYIDEL